MGYANGHFRAGHPSYDLFRIGLRIVRRIGLVSLTGVKRFESIQGVVVLHPLAQWFGGIVMPLHQCDDIFRLSSCHLHPPFYVDSVPSFDVAVPKSVYEAVDHSFYAMIILVFGDFANYIPFPICFPPVRLGLSVERIGC